MISVLQMTAALSPIRCRLILAAVLALGFVGRVLYFNIDSPVGLSGDEAHYWDWSRQLDLSYYSKGPAVAYLIRFGCMLFGDTEFGVRFPAMLLAIGICVATYWLTLRVTRSEPLALGAVLLCHVIPMFVAGSMLMTIDPPYYFGWGIATCLAHVAIFDNRRWAWPLAGVFVGLAFLAKYAALIWLVCLLIFLILSPTRRAYLKTIWPYVTIIVSLLFTIPVIVWNARHDWVTLGHVARSTTENQSHFNVLEILKNLGLMFGSQIGILNPLVAVIMIAALGVAMRGRHHTFLLAFSLPFMGVVTVVTFFKEIEPNWPAATYFTLVPLTIWYIARSWPRTRNITIAAAALGILFIPLLHFTTVLYPVMPVEPRKWDPSFRLQGGADIGRAVSAQLKILGPDAFVLCEKYQGAGQMAFYVEGHPRTYYCGSYFKEPARRDRLSQYDMWPDRSLEQDSLKGRDAVYVGHAQPDIDDAFERVVRLPALPIVRHGVTIREQTLFLCYGFRGMTRPGDGLTKR
ncbi:MAG: glycosyltransferase family 39 protein [Burkholderiales bacterium]|nr:glycosyltransferase family 39 protein [Phycisphaerae bacterium]